MKIVIFGTGRYYQSAKKYINFNDVVCFADNDESKTDQTINGKKVKKPESINYEEVDYVLILIIKNADLGGSA